MLGYKDFGNERLPQSFVRITSARERGSTRTIRTTEMPPTSVPMSKALLLVESRDILDAIAAENETYLERVRVQEIPQDPERTESDTSNNGTPVTPRQTKSSSRYDPQVLFCVVLCQLCGLLNT